MYHHFKFNLASHRKKPWGQVQWHISIHLSPAHSYVSRRYSDYDGKQSVPMPFWLRLDYKDLSALCYHSAEQETNKINTLETARPDVATHRGIRIGMKRDEVLSAYPTIYDTPYWSYDGDYLWYCKNKEGFGAALLFWFQNDIVTKIELIHMFD